MVSKATADLGVTVRCMIDLHKMTSMEYSLYQFSRKIVTCEVAFDALRYEGGVDMYVLGTCRMMCASLHGK